LGLVSEQKGKLTTGVNRLFVGSDSLMISRHHTNWRMRSIESLDRGTPIDLHFSTLFTFAKDDLLKIRESIVQNIEASRKIVRESKAEEEELFCFDVDFLDFKSYFPNDFEQVYGHQYMREPHCPSGTNSHAAGVFYFFCFTLT